MTCGYGPTVSLHSRVSSPVARAQLRKLYRHARKVGNTKFDARIMIGRAVLAAGAEADEAFAGGIRAVLLARRVAVDIVRRSA